MADPTPIETPQEYLLEIRDGKAEEVFRAMLIPNVSSFERRPMPADDKVYSIRLGARPITQSAGIVTEEWSFRGLSGEEEREVTFVDRRSDWRTGTSGTKLIAGGVEIFEELLRFLRDYEARKAEWQSAYRRRTSDAPRMVVRALKEGLAYYCDEIHITPLRAVGSSRNSYEYTLTLTTEGEALAEPYNELVNNPVKALPHVEADAAKQLKKVAALPAKVIPAGTGARDQVVFTDGAVAGVAAIGSLARALSRLPGDLAAWRAPVEQFAAQVAESIEAVERGVTSGIGFPRDLAANLATYAARASASIYRLWDGLELPLRDRARAIKDELNRAFRSVQRSSARVLGTAGSRLGQPADDQTTAATGGPQAFMGIPVRLVRLPPGWDLAALAARWLGDASRWRELIRLNGMISAWEMSDGRPLGPGTPMRVPIEGEPTRPDADPSDIYGTDLRWDFRRHDIVTEGDSPTDFVAVSGAKNLRQAMLRRATVTQGRCRVFPRLGIPHNIGSNTSAELSALLASQIVTQFAADPRIKLVRNVQIAQLANTFSARLVVEGIAGETLPLTGLSAPTE